MQDKMCVCNVCLDAFLDPRSETGNDDNVQNSHMYASPTVQHLGGGVSVMGLQSAQWTMGLVYVLGFGGKLVIKERDLFGPIGEKYILRWLSLKM